MSVVFFYNTRGKYFEKWSGGDVLVRQFHWTECQSKAYKFSSQEEGEKLLSEWWLSNPDWLQQSKYGYWYFTPISD